MLPRPIHASWGAILAVGVVRREIEQFLMDQVEGRGVLLLY